MKKLFLLLACVAMSVLAMGQDNQLVWANGRLLYGTPIESIDSLTYDEMEDVDTLHLLLPRTLIKVVHDTVYIHDTVYVETDCGGEDNPTDPSAGIGVFSVAEGRTVTFSKGNLQYHPANNEWRFAENQTDYIGDANSNCSSIYNGWLDLFGWSTSTTNFGVSTSTNVNDYSGDFVDWGINQIGDDAPNTWRTLTKDEWLYIFNHRKNAQSLFASGNVNGVNGLILLPDSWVTPDSLSFEASINKGLYWEGTGYYNPSADNYTHNVYTSEEWEKLEQSGAVFLPASGARKGTNVYAIYYDGYVWSSTNYNEEFAYYLLFGLRRIGPQDNYFTRDYAFPVRLVQDIQLE